MLEILTLRHGADDVLSGGPDFGVGCVHGVKQQPVLVASLQHQRLTTQDGDAVPLWNEKTLYWSSQENSAVIIHTLKATHMWIHKDKDTFTCRHTHLPYRGHLWGSATWCPVSGQWQNWTSPAGLYNPQTPAASTGLWIRRAALLQSDLQWF